jgi:hypothetical protein
MRSKARVTVSLSILRGEEKRSPSAEEREKKRKREPERERKNKREKKKKRGGENHRGAPPSACRPLSALSFCLSDFRSNFLD